MEFVCESYDLLKIQLSKNLIRLSSRRVHRNSRSEESFIHILESIWCVTRLRGDKIKTHDVRKEISRREESHGHRPKLGTQMASLRDKYA